MLASSGVAGAGMLGLATVGCGDDDDSGGSSGSTGSTPAPQATAAPAQIKRGGTLQFYWPAGTATIDPHRSSVNIVKGASLFAYSTLFMVEPTTPDAYGGIPTNIVPDIADGMPQISADAKTYTVKLNPKAKFHPPLNRAVTAEDVVFSWRRFTGQVTGIPVAVGAERLEGIETVRAADEKTVVFQLKQPYSMFTELLADPFLLIIMPKEAGTGYDPAQTMVGSGPFLFDSMVADSVFKFKRNPEWHFGPDRPYVDRVELNVFLTADLALTQFLGGKLDYNWAVRALEIQQIKSAIPKAQFKAMAASGGQGAGLIGFDRVSEPRPRAPWTDVRVRRALSMAIDRDAINDVFNNFSELAGLGLVPTKKAAGGLIGRTYGDVTLDPREQASVSKWYAYDPTGAKALLDQAGGGFDIQMHYATALGNKKTVAELIQGYWGKLGVKVEIIVDDLNAVWFPKTTLGDLSGCAMPSFTAPLDPMGMLDTEFSSKSPRNLSRVRDTKLDQLLAQYYLEPDKAKRAQILKDFQLHALDQVYYIPDQTGNGVPQIVAFQPNVQGIDKVTLTSRAQSELATRMWKDG